MIKRVTALLVCLMMLIAMPLSAFASDDGDAVSPASGSVRYISSGSITIGTALLYDADGNELPLEYAYSPRVTISQSISGQLSEKLSDCGFSLPAMTYDYQLMNSQSFFVVRVTDGQALARVIDSMMSPEAPDSDVPEVSDAVSDTDVSSTDVSASDASGSDVTASTAPVTPDADAAESKETDSAPISGTSLHSLLLGAASFEAYPTLEASLSNAFPEFTFNAPEAAALPQTLNSVSGVAIDPDGMTAQVTVMPEPEYVEREVFGEVFQVLMVSSVAYRYELSRYDVAGTTDGAVIPEKPEEPEVSSSDTTAEVTTTTTTATTTTTTESEDTTTTASTTTTTTTEATTTTTTAADDNNDGFPREGIVSTTWRRLNMRTGPGLGYKVIDQLSKGTTVTVLEYDEDGWYKIKLSDGTTGWCTDEYITLR